jgi:signal transduction histidine kinase/ligand-binding sensor domain-containing protein
MRRLVKPWLLAFLLTTGYSIHAQIQDVRFNLFTGTNGVTLGKINNMVRDKYGFLWFSDESNRSIIRFDGSHMKRYQYDPQNPNSLGGYYPECLATDSSGNIWIGFLGMGLDKFDPVANQFTHYRHSDHDPASLHNDIVCAILFDHLGNAWIGNYSGLDLLDQKTGKFKHYSRKNDDPTSLSCDSVRALYEDRAGELWVGTGFVFDDTNPNGGLNLFHRDNGTFTRYMHDPKNPNSLIANRVKAIFEDSYGTFWVGTDGDGLHTLDRQTGKFTRHTYDPSKPEQLSRTALKSIFDNITFITEDADKKIWIGTLENGIIRYDPVSKQIIHYGSDDDKKGLLKDESSWWANATPDGFVWISTQNDNLFKVDIYSTTIPFFGEANISSRPGFTNKEGVSAFYVEGDSVLWLGTDSGLTRKDLRNATSHRYLNDPHNSNSLSNNGVTTILKDTANHFWIGTTSGLNEFSPTTGKFIRYYPESTNAHSAFNYISKICRDGLSNIWVGSYGGGLHMLNPATGKFRVYKNNLADSATTGADLITDVIVDSNDLWIGNDSHYGLTRMNLLTNQRKRYLRGLIITTIYKDADDNIWVGTKGGLYQFNRALDDFPVSEQNAASNIVQVEGILSDRENNLWISTETGIFMLNKSRDHAIHFGKEYGVPEGNNFFHYGSAFCAQNGEMYFGTNRGYFAFYPEKITVSAHDPKLYFTGFWLNNQQILPDSSDILKQPLDETKEIRLQYNQNVFAISATFVDFRNAAHKTLYYKLDNYDADWRVAQPEDKITFFKVPVGKYIFRIKITNANNESWIEKSISIIILPPWWATWWAYCFYGFCLLAGIYFTDRIRKKVVIEKERARAKEKELAQAREIERAYHDLKKTQAQLIQSEKMASLGELTAGIAHEIQNPLNFMNNFSEVNTELIEEMKDEFKAGNQKDGFTIADHIAENERKISHHGKRADAIVKGMLQHTRMNTGTKEPRDINAVVDEYLRLSYHGFRAKEQSFTAEMITNYDPAIGSIHIIPQDIGRVLLNIFNNAYYAISEKKKQQHGTYVPAIDVSTRKAGNNVEIRVKDNGNGMPQQVKDKIFQPFFTTKPTGQGTGLGLSMSYDIIKAHGGEISVETREGEFTEFVVLIPVG